MISSGGGYIESLSGAMTGVLSIRAAADVDLGLGAPSWGGLSVGAAWLGGLPDRISFESKEELAQERAVGRNVSETAVRTPQQRRFIFAIADPLLRCKTHP